MTGLGQAPKEPWLRKANPGSNSQSFGLAAGRFRARSSDLFIDTAGEIISADADRQFETAGANCLAACLVDNILCLLRGMLHGLHEWVSAMIKSLLAWYLAALETG